MERYHVIQEDMFWRDIIRIGKYLSAFRRGLQDIDFPKCTIIFQDLKNSRLLIFKFPRCIKFPNIDIPNCPEIPRRIKRYPTNVIKFSEVCHIE